MCSLNLDPETLVAPLYTFSLCKIQTYSSAPQTTATKDPVKIKIGIAASSKLKTLTICRVGDGGVGSY